MESKKLLHLPVVRYLWSEDGPLIALASAFVLYPVRQLLVPVPQVSQVLMAHIPAEPTNLHTVVTDAVPRLHKVTESRVVETVLCNPVAVLETALRARPLLPHIPRVLATVAPRVEDLAVFTDRLIKGPVAVKILLKTLKVVVIGLFTHLNPIPLRLT